MTTAAKSKRGQRNVRVLTPMEQIRMPSSAADQVKGAWAYYLRPDGATIRDALILYPNGGVPEDGTPRERAKFGTNADLYRSMQARKGFTYLGQRLTEEAMVKVCETIKANAEDEVLFCQERIADAEEIIATSDRPEVRDQQKRRRDAFKRRIHYITQEVDAEALAAELKEIARAQQLASVDPNILSVMKSMVGEVSDSLAAKIAKFQQGKPTDDGAPRRRGRPPRADVSDDFTGADFVDAS